MGGKMYIEFSSNTNGMKTVLVPFYFLDLGQISHLSKYTSGSDLSVRTRFPYLQLQPSSSHCLPPAPFGSHITHQTNKLMANKVLTSLCVQICLFTILQFAIAILVVFSRYLLDQFHALSLLLLLASQLLLLYNLYITSYIISIDQFNELATGITVCILR